MEKQNLIAKKFQSGGIEGVVWNNNKDNKIFQSVTIQKKYKAKDGSWKTSSSFNESDLPKVNLVIQKAYEFLALKAEA